MSPTKASLQRRDENLFRIAALKENNAPKRKKQRTTSPISTLNLNCSQLTISSNQSENSLEISTNFDISESDNFKIKKWIVLYRLNEKIKLLHKIEADKEVQCLPKKSDRGPQLSPSYQARLIKSALQNK